MRLIILAAGQGKRLSPLTFDKPKCMVKYQGQPIIDMIVSTAHKLHINDIVLVNGYKKEVLEEHLRGTKIQFVTNHKYNNSNMVHTLFCAEKFMDDDLIISYADIVYKSSVLNKLINSKNNFSVVVDHQWKKLWAQRMDNPLLDAETLKIKNNTIYEIGKKPLDYDDIDGQYIGLIKISKKILPMIIDLYHSLDKNSLFDGRDFYNLYMTDFIQIVINNYFKVSPVFVDGGWVEIDEVSDLNTKMVSS